MSDSSIMSVKELIEMAFGDPDKNVVNFKLIETVLFIISRQLRILERRVAVVYGDQNISPSSKLSITEVKMHAKKDISVVDKTSKRQGAKSETGKYRKGLTEKEKQRSKKPTGDSEDQSAKSKRSGTSGKMYEDERDFTKTTYGKEYADDDISSKSKKRTKKPEGTMNYDDETKSIKSGRQKYDDDEKEYTKKTKTPFSSKPGRSEVGASATDDEDDTKKKSREGKMYEDESDIVQKSKKTSASKQARSAIDALTTDDEDDTSPKSKKKPDRGKIDEDERDTAQKSKMSSVSKQARSAVDASTTDDEDDNVHKSKKKSGKGKIIENDGDTALKSKKASAKDYEDFASIKSKKSGKETAAGNETVGSHSRKTKKEAQKLSASDSTDDGQKYRAKSSSIKKEHKSADVTQLTGSSKKTQKTFQGLSTMEEIYEKELRIINQRADSREEPDPDPRPMTKITDSEIQREKLLIVQRRSAQDTRSKEDTPINLSIVTQEQFDKLVKEVQDLEARFGPINVPGFPENAQLMRELRKSASLTDAMAALQLSARLEAAETTLKKMIQVVTELAHTTPGVDLPKSQTVDVPATGKVPMDEKEMLDEKPEITDTNVTNADLKAAMDSIYQQIMKDLNAANSRAKATAESAINTAKKLEEKLDSALELEDRIEELDGLVAEYTDRITTMDTGVSSQMAAYQDQLAQMQFDLEVGMDAMTESLANTGGDPAAVAELNAKLNSFQTDLENTTLSQKELKEMQCLFSVDLETLYKQIEVINETKCDRDEVVDALQDKIGLADLNGRVKQDEFDAVRGDFEKRIADAFHKFNNQELVWQKIIDEIVREINEKVDEVQMTALRDQINSHLEALNKKYEELSNIVGEPRAAAISRRLIREGNCLSCSTPAQLTELTRPPGDGHENTTHLAEGGDTKVAPKPCMFGQPIPHPIDPRAFFCQRYCGGAHTVSSAGDRVPLGILGKPLSRHTGAMIIGSDGKPFVSDQPEMVPCKPCNTNRPCLCNLEPPAVPNSINAKQTTGKTQKKSTMKTPSDLTFMFGIDNSQESNIGIIDSLVAPSID